MLEAKDLWIVVTTDPEATKKIKTGTTASCGSSVISNNGDSKVTKAHGEHRKLPSQESICVNDDTIQLQPLSIRFPRVLLNE